MKRIAVLAVTLSASLGAVVVTPSGVRADDAAFTSGGTLSDATGAVIYSHICQGCHMPEGQGAIGAGHYPKLAGDPALISGDYVALIVLNGRNGMPPFGLPSDQIDAVRTAHLSDAQIADVVNYVRTHFGNKFKNKETEAQVKALPHPNDPPLAD